MELLPFPSLLILFSSFLFLSVVVKIVKKMKFIDSKKKLPPWPWKLPFICNLHQVVGSLPHRILRDLADQMDRECAPIAWDIVMAPYGNYWRQVRKICTVEPLTAKRVQSFESIRQEEVSDLVKYISSNQGSPINLTKKIFSMTYGITSRAAFSNICKGRDSYSIVVDEIMK
ncbi:hypothetical protein GOBAR_AA14804 [Gossypium barbadense]|uniref:Cytochrome P450 n=1 Tax=Gossypium barbadense TaxID=3634 RepID=A0A2P5XR70_GOSBA|nr:hypothetical protein GOBAR_AA14804 [Gossypium barbadense]